MIRLNKEVQLLEWGEGTNTTNQRWSELGKGKIINQAKPVNGVTTLVIQINGSFQKKNPHDDSIKVVQKGEGMTPLGTDTFGEVAFGRLKSISGEGANATVEVEVKVAVKVDRDPLFK